MPTTLRLSVVSLCLSAFLLAGCAHDSKNQDAGTALGAVAGGLAGLAFGKGSGRIVAVLAGAGIGALIGNRLGAMLDDREKQAMAEASQHAAETAQTNQRIAWAAEAAPEPAAVPATQSTGTARTSTAPKPVAKPKPQTASGWVIPKTDSYQKNGQTCRDMTQVAVKDGKEVSDDVTLCRSVASDGGTSWAIPKA